MNQVKYKNTIWHDLSKPDKKKLHYLAEKYELDSFDTEDCLQVTQRSKLEIRKNYIFVILRLPIYNTKTQTLKATEVDVFCGKNFVITVCNDKFKTTSDLRREILDNEDSQKFFLSTSGVLFYEIMHRLYARSFPMLDHIAEDIDSIEDHIFEKDSSRQAVEEISSIRRNIINLRKIMRTHNVLISHLNRIKPEKFGITRYFKKRHNTDLSEDLTNIWDIIESHKETIEALESTNETLISYHLNRTILFLTIASIIFLPMNLIATIFGVNTNGTPWMNNPMGFTYIIGLVLGSGTILAILFKLKRR